MAAILILGVLAFGLFRLLSAFRGESDHYTKFDPSRSEFQNRNIH